MKNFLTNKERELLLNHHKAESSRKIADRIKVVILADRGMSYVDIAKALLINEETVSRHVSDYINDEKKLTLDSGGSSSFLNEKQTDALVEHLKKVTYTNSYHIIAYVKLQFGVEYTHSGMLDWLHQHGFSFKKPAATPAKADPVKQAEFIEEYKQLKSSLSDNDVLLFGDGVHPTMQTKVSYGWIPKGENKPIQTTASKTRINIFSTLNLHDMQIQYNYYETINSKSMVHFFHQLKHQYDGKNIHLILDRGPYNTSQETVNAAKELGIILHHLPAYSPNLNPIERVWKVLNEETRNNIFFETAKDFKKAVLNFFEERWYEIKDKMLSRINDNFQTLKSVF